MRTPVALTWGRGRFGCAEAPTVRYFRTACAWLTMPRIVSETTGGHFRFPI